jgi:hypothetical protein
MGIGILLLFTVSFSFSQPYFVSVSGINFVGETEIVDYDYHNTVGYVNKPTTPGYLFCDIQLPDYLRYIERMSFTYFDFTTAGYMFVQLRKVNRWDGTSQIIAYRATGVTDASNLIRTTSVILGAGRGIDNSNYNYFLRVYFSQSGDDLRLYSVTFKCQPY